MLCQDLLKQGACTEMHLQWNVTRFCAMLAWLRSCVRIFLDMASWAELCQDVFGQILEKRSPVFALLTQGGLGDRTGPTTPFATR